MGESEQSVRIEYGFQAWKVKYFRKWTDMKSWSGSTEVKLSLYAKE